MTSNPIKISIIIPTLNEEGFICKLLAHLHKSDLTDVEVIVSDGGSSDLTLERCNEFNSVLTVKCSKKGRAVQMNSAADMAKGEILYFVHADTLPPLDWKKEIVKAINSGHKIGGFRFKFDSNRPLLRLNSWFTRFNIQSFRGGDQSIFITNSFFNELGKYPNWEIMEEYGLIRKAIEREENYHLIQKSTLVSARKYEKNSYLKVNWINLRAMMKFNRGVDHRAIKEFYKQNLN